MSETDKPGWQGILENFTRTAQGQDLNEKLARYAARENARAEHFASVVGATINALEAQRGQSNEIDELVDNVVNYLRAGIAEANSRGFKAQQGAAGDH